MRKIRHFHLTLPNGRLVKIRWISEFLDTGSPCIELYACNGQFLGDRVRRTYADLLNAVQLRVLQLGQGHAALSPLGDLITWGGIEPCGLKEVTKG